MISSDTIASYFGRRIVIGIYTSLYLYHLPVVLIENMQELDFKKNCTLINKLVLDFEGRPQTKAKFVSPSHPLYSSERVSVYLI